MSTPAGTDSVREKILTDYRKKLLEHKELEARLKESKYLTLIEETVHVWLFLFLFWRIHILGVACRGRFRIVIIL